jgi:hypothetical protein
MRRRRKIAGRLLPAFFVAAALLTVPSGAGAATQVGQTVDPTTSACSQNFTWLQSVSPSNQFVVPSDGVITSWSHLGGPTPPPQLKLKVGSVGATSLTITGESAVVAPLANQMNTYPTRVPARAGEVIGFYHTGSNLADCAAPGQIGYADAFANGDILPPGGTGTPITTEPGQLDVSALLEPDCDKDGLGDQTQDSNISSCGAGAKPLSCKGKLLTMVGTPGIDTITGTPQPDVIAALGGNDKVSGLGGSDLICGGGGKDKLKGGAGNDTLLGQGGNDILKGGGGNDLCKGGKGKDTLASC